MLKSVKLWLLLLVVALIVVFYALELQRYFDIAYLEAQRDAIFAFRDGHFWLSSAAYFFLYVTVAALSLPAAAIVTLVGGAVFGFWWGLLLVSFASSIGATLGNGGWATLINSAKGPLLINGQAPIPPPSIPEGRLSLPLPPLPPG
jgi:hypothetical protein